MKTRLGFVSNSSSASFIVNKAYLTPAQSFIVEHHVDSAAKSSMDWPDEADGWIMEDNGTYYRFSTWMDNFALDEFFESMGIHIENYHSGS
jgi:hypothetical protein